MTITRPDMAALTCQKLQFEADDGHRISACVWTPAQAPRAIIQLLHGLGEYAARYERFATVCIAQRYAVVAHDHRGHGENCDESDLGNFADQDGWQKVIADCLQVQRHALATFPDTPLVVLGHSMGSFIAQSFVMKHPADVDALVLSASSLSSRAQLFAGRLVSRIERWRIGTRGKSELLNKLSFGDFNQRFAPNRTEFDWLSRDQDEVDKYVSDPLCGAASTCGLWFDLTSALPGISTNAALRKIPAGLPILIFGGEVDPVGGRNGLTKLARAYRQSGHTDVTLTIYPDGRHEMLNETNRDEVTADILGWIETTLL